MSRAAITQPTKIFFGTSGTVAVPKGCVLLYLTCTGNGSVIGIPDGTMTNGVANSQTLTIPNTTQWFIYDAPSLNIVFNPGSSSPVWNVVFNGTTSYLMEVMNPAGGF